MRTRHIYSFENVCVCVCLPGSALVAEYHTDTCIQHNNRFDERKAHKNNTINEATQQLKDPTEYI